MSPLRNAVDAARRPEVISAIHAIYIDLGREIAAVQPKCDASGRCCHFEAFGHRLYITTAELAVFLNDLEQQRLAPSPSPSLLPILKDAQPDCPFQIEGLCSVHPLRPFGCRIFFCDLNADAWMTSAYERFHARIKQLHADLGLDYRYMEWRSALRELKILPNDP